MILGAVKKHHETEYEVEVDWEIKKFLSRSPLSLYTTSNPLFTWSSYDWELGMLYNRSEMKLHLRRSKSEKTFPSILKFGIRTKDGIIENRCLLIKTFTDLDNFFMTYEFIQGAELKERKDQLLPKGNLTIFCSISHLDSLKNKPNCHQYENYKSHDLSSDFEALYNSTNITDMTMVVGTERFSVHKAVLAARSDVFSRMFQSDMEEVRTGIVKISNCDPRSFKDFLLYLYTDKVNISSSNVCHLYRIADKYNVQKLKLFCVTYMKGSLSVASLLDVIVLADQFGETDLLNIAQDFFNNHALEIMKGDDWEQFQKRSSDNVQITNQLMIRMLEKVKI